eukprot:EG_transcript_10887
MAAPLLLDPALPSPPDAGPRGPACPALLCAAALGSALLATCVATPFAVSTHGFAWPAGVTAVPAAQLATPPAPWAAATSPTQSRHMAGPSQRQRLGDAARARQAANLPGDALAWLSALALGVMVVVALFGLQLFGRGRLGHWAAPQTCAMLSFDGLPANGRPNIVVLNGAKLNFDDKLDLLPLKLIGNVTVWEDTDPDNILEVMEHVANQHVVVTKEMRVTRAMIDKFPLTVRLLCEAGTGHNNVDGAGARTANITVCNVPAYSSDAVAHLVITYILALSCSLLEQQRLLWQGDYSQFRRFTLPHYELTGRTLGLVGGTGGIGRRVADLGLALGLKVLVSTRQANPPVRPGVEYVTFEQLLSRSDFISIHCPLSAETKGLFDMKAFGQVKRGAYLINTARGPIVNEEDLVAALRIGFLAGAALDVQDPEPPLASSPLWDMDNVILTPHIGWKRLESRQRLMQTVADNIRAYMAGSPINVVN